MNTKTRVPMNPTLSGPLRSRRRTPVSPGPPQTPRGPPGLRFLRSAPGPRRRNPV
ncbi:hypothetical protein EYF80_065425 [Liparis tanakae]|uniref:Uncharacterized protein n=1 Tax=Liparis tanakae TaxID=230148 RepID=A0A4Z2E7A8_9TELE|nr:hypothetical protein EYF80_065425 [Liparis tanakae]